MLRVKTLEDYLFGTMEAIPKCEMVLYIHDGLDHRYRTFFTIFNMSQVKTFVEHNQFENFEMMLFVFKGVAKE